ncbi:Sarcoplasmic reticulum histidine-rich calcium-binding protein [Acropora cervicornis]|uniref:Sarcoplasmic reticulum histidine-rich calcium-binding protein n=1 Tax=Acropora cervicornis TaxID=6130 RepID=A0AAD9PYS4_ACRCE|nr:Sarcoplasmic reticulum histidine-rich calcium-binding protein [Acropora cervicornis]
MKILVIVSIYSLVLLSHATQADEKTGEEPLQEPKVTEKSEVVNDATSEGEQKDKEYALGSLCNYCSYCKFCELCDVDCPCEKSKKKPNCHLCKYCKYCSLCSVCDTVCKPGPSLKLATIKCVRAQSSLPAFDKDTKEKVDKDIESARKWIKEYL